MKVQLTQDKQIQQPSSVTYGMKGKFYDLLDSVGVALVKEGAALEVKPEIETKPEPVAKPKRVYKKKVVKPQEIK